MGYKDFVEYICKNYKNAKKIVEVGVGREFTVIRELRRNLDAKIIATDIREKERGKDFIKDDILNPDLKIYEGAELIYSLRPPPEFIPYLEKVARKAGADLIIKPMSTEAISHKSLRLINYKRATFYLGKFRKSYISD